eukprot:g10472.t1
MQGDKGEATVEAYIAESLLNERLEEEQEALEEARMFQEALNNLPMLQANYDAAMAALLADESAGEAARSTQGPPEPELSTTSPIGHKPSEVEALPLTYRDVKRSKYRAVWDEAINKELGGHDETGTFSKILDLPDGRKVISSKWVFAWKVDENGLITDFKARSKEDEDLHEVDLSLKEAVGCMMWSATFTMLINS